jgi:hypothetical protein
MFGPGTQAAQTGDIPMTELILGEIVERTGLLTGQCCGRGPSFGVDVGLGDVTMTNVAVVEGVTFVRRIDGVCGLGEAAQLENNKRRIISSTQRRLENIISFSFFSTALR